MATHLEPVNVSQWIEENSRFFLPPVCNKLMHEDGQINVMFVGGPNQREDYHIEAGEEIFLLPRAIPHSPQRFADTVGLVIERLRKPNEFDTLRYFVEDNGHLTPETLYEMTFHWQEERNQMPKFFKRYYNSEEHRTKKPLPGTLTDIRSLSVDSKRVIPAPFPLNEWIRENRRRIDSSGRALIFDTNNLQTQAFICGRGEISECVDVAETWIWQLEEDSVVETEGESVKLNPNDSLLVPPGKRFTLIQREGSLAFLCYQDPTNA